jgi:hypothetical protein
MICPIRAGAAWYSWFPPESIERAKSIGLVAKKNAVEAETLRRMPDETVQAIVRRPIQQLL